jgi:hypothetical protein
MIAKNINEENRVCKLQLGNYTHLVDPKAQNGNQNRVPLLSPVLRDAAL